MNKLCLLEERYLYKEKIGYRLDSKGEIKQKIYKRLHTAFNSEDTITLYKGSYPNISRYEIDGTNCSDREVIELIKDVIINLTRFNNNYNTDLYKDDIEKLRQYLTKHDKQLLDIDLGQLK